MYQKFRVRAPITTYKTQNTYSRFRVRTPVKTFRDLEVYQEAVKLSARLFNLKIPKGQKKSEELEAETKTLKENSKLITKLLVESYDDKFGKMASASKKLELAVQAANMIVAKLDFLTALIEEQKWRDELAEILKRYQRLKMRTLNLKRAWERVFKK